MNRNISLIVIAASICAGGTTTATFGQTVYLDSGMKRVKPEMAAHTVALTPGENGIYTGIVTNPDHSILMSGQYIAWKDTFVEHGIFTFYHPNGEVESVGEYDRGVRVGTWKRFAYNGDPRGDRYYSPEGASTLRKVLGIDL